MRRRYYPAYPEKATSLLQEIGIAMGESGKKPTRSKSFTRLVFGVFLLSALMFVFGLQHTADGAKMIRRHEHTVHPSPSPKPSTYMLAAPTPTSSNKNVSGV